MKKFLVLWAVLISIFSFYCCNQIKDNSSNDNKITKEDAWESLGEVTTYTIWNTTDFLDRPKEVLSEGSVGTLYCRTIGNKIVYAFEFDKSYKDDTKYTITPSDKYPSCNAVFEAPDVWKNERIKYYLSVPGW